MDYSQQDQEYHIKTFIDENIDLVNNENRYQITINPSENYIYLIKTITELLNVFKNNDDYKNVINNFNFDRLRLANKYTNLLENNYVYNLSNDYNNTAMDIHRKILSSLKENMFSQDYSNNTIDNLNNQLKDTYINMYFLYNDLETMVIKLISHAFLDSLENHEKQMKIFLNDHDNLGKFNECYRKNILLTLKTKCLSSKKMFRLSTNKNNAMYERIVISHDDFDYFLRNLTINENMKNIFVNIINEIINEKRPFNNVSLLSRIYEFFESICEINKIVVIELNKKANIRLPYIKKMCKH